MGLPIALHTLEMCSFSNKPLSTELLTKAYTISSTYAYNYTICHFLTTYPAMTLLRLLEPSLIPLTQTLHYLIILTVSD